MALFMGIGASMLIAILRRQPLVLGAVGVVIVLNWVAAMHFVSTLGRESNEARADVDFTREVAAKLPTGALIISTNPCIWNLLGRNASQLFNVENMVRNEMRELVRQYPGGIYLHWDYWANTEPNHAKRWRQLIVDTHAIVFARRNAEAVQFAVFRLDTPYACEVFGGHSKIGGPVFNVDDTAAEALAAPTTNRTGKPAAGAPNAARQGQTIP
jgi:hypothetical protein